MTWQDVLGLVLSVGLLVYLTWALIRSDKVG